MTTKEKLELGMKMVSTLGVLFGALSFWYGQKAVSETHDWNRRVQAMEIIRSWNPRIGQQTQHIKKEYHDKITTHTAISGQEAKKIVAREGDGYDEKYQELIWIFNHFESVSSAYRNNIADQSILDQSVKNTMLLWFDVFKPFLDEMEAQRNYSPWKPYTDLIIEWDVETVDKDTKNKLGQTTGFDEVQRI